MSERKPSGYQIERAMSAYQASRARLMEIDAEIDAASIDAALPDETADVCTLLDRLLRGALEDAGLAALADNRIEELQARRDRFKRRAAEKRTTAAAIMDALELRKRELPDLTASIRMGAKLVIVTDETKLEDRFFRIIPASKAVDKAALKTALDTDGEIIEGAMLTNGAPTLSIRKV